MPPPRGPSQLPLPPAAGYDRTEQELQRFLSRMVEDGKLEHSGGQYKIRPG